MWPGYLTIGGMEIANAGRTEAYVRANTWFKPLYGATDLHKALDEDQYRSPLLDPAPWADRNVPQSTNFFGFYLLDATGAEDSTREVTYTEATIDGARPSRVRHNSKTIVFNGVLIGCNEQAVEYGMRWLRNALLASPCAGSNGCAGSDMCYFATQPCTEEDTEDCWDYAVMQTGRTLRRFAVTTGPNITAKQQTTDGAVVWTVTFTGQAGVPWEYGFERCVVKGFMDPLVTSPFECGDVNGTPEDEGYPISDLDENGKPLCKVQAWAPLYDPECPSLEPPPSPPAIDISCMDLPTEWTRRTFTIPGETIPLWTDLVPVIAVTTGIDEVRNLRIRFYSDPFEGGNPEDDPCAFCGDFVLTYIPPNTQMVLDGAVESVVVTSQNQPPRNASTLVFAADGTPFSWPLLSCGVGYIVTIDLPATFTDTLPIIDFALVPRAA